MYTETVTCTCCRKQFTGQGYTKQEALEEANEKMQDHLDRDEC